MYFLMLYSCVKIMHSVHAMYLTVSCVNMTALVVDQKKELSLFGHPPPPPPPPPRHQQGFFRKQATLHFA